MILLIVSVVLMVYGILAVLYVLTIAGAIIIALTLALIHGVRYLFNQNSQKVDVKVQSESDYLSKPKGEGLQKHKPRLRCKRYISRRGMKIFNCVVLIIFPCGGLWYAMLMQKMEESVKERYWFVMMEISTIWGAYVIPFQILEKHYLFLSINLLFLICVVELYLKRKRLVKKT